MSTLKSAFFVAFCVVFCRGDSSIYPYDLTVEYLKNPLAVDVPKPRLSWKLNGNIVNGSIPRNLSQTAYQIIAASNSNLLQETPDLWDSGKVISDNQLNIPYEGKIPGAGQRIYWSVRVWDQADNVSSYASRASWDVGHATEWSALWISAPDGLQKRALANLTDEDKKVISSLDGLKPTVYLRKHFSIDSQVKEAKVYATAKGLYKLFINNEIDVPLLSPGWTEYKQTLQYQVYNVTKHIRSRNTIGVILGTGWYSGYVGFLGKFGTYGNKESFLLELHVEFLNGSRIVIGTDSTWKVSTGPLVYSDLLQGELYYEDRHLQRWTSSEYDDGKWSAVDTAKVNKTIALIADRGQPVVELERLHPREAWEISPGVWVYDFGLNFAGYVSIELENVTSNVRIQVRHAEILNDNRTLYTLNLRTARAIDTYLLNDPKTRTGKVLLKPHFTYHGFRYVEVTGLPTQLSTIRGVRIGIEGINNRVTTDNKLVNALLSNARNSHLANFISVPTDCPQRDERLGWMADAQVFIETAIYDGPVAAFMTKWMRDVREAQSPTSGRFTDISPIVVDEAEGSPAWGDAGVIITWHLYRMYGDLRIIEENFANMERHVKSIWDTNPSLLWVNKTNQWNFGDWLAVVDSPREVFSTAFFAYDALLLSKMAKAIGKSAEADKYSKLYSSISDVFVKEFVNITNGKIRGDTQTLYLLAVAFEILPSDLRPKAVKNLVDDIKKNDWHLTTGFGGVNYLLPVLSDYGYDDVAYKLLLQTTYPSWGYMVEMNATTYWESWRNYVEVNGSLIPTELSFNHYALGSVGRWIYRYMAGIDTDEVEVGFKKIIFKPHIGQGVNHTVAWYSSAQGSIGIEWQTVGNKLDVLVTVPVNAKAQIIITFAEKTWIKYVPSGQYQYSFP